MRIDRSGKPYGLRDVVASVLAAAFGVQSGNKRERDFQHGSLGQFIVVGIIATVLFIAVVFLAVRLVLKTAGV